jgi:hypothetical protein
VDPAELSGFTAIVAVDFEFEFGGCNGNLSRPVCMAAREFRNGKIWRLWEDELGLEPPFSVDDRALFLSFTASAELGCFKVLGWPMPARILDLSAEYRLWRSGKMGATGPRFGPTAQRPVGTCQRRTNISLGRRAGCAD